ncbi:acyl-CoA thioesterase [Clostridium psychrophilum]|uniref:acyl-CoA thioesterase n=1 Tax=Clostridium psychrophilum TaxID=132926 RepID=UPI001C0D49B0|nr:acyl-CoA thioesterase [Clostridium psychrophilum]MBU3179765.1 acyl-CoA thioesterase [Clostridium psychrophilum]
MDELISESRLVISQVMLPNQANVAGNVHGGEIMKLMDLAAYAVGRRFAHTNVVTARVDELEFHLPIFIGDLVICTAQVAYAGKSSMEIVVTVEVEDLECSDRKKALSSFFTMVALDKKGKTSLVPKLILNSPEEIAAFDEGKKRYELYKEKRKQRADNMTD